MKWGERGQWSTMQQRRGSDTTMQRSDGSIDADGQCKIRRQIKKVHVPVPGGSLATGYSSILVILSLNKLG